MKKTAILLTLVMIISLIPILNVSAADEYYLKGLHEGENIVANVERSRKVTVVNLANATGLPGNASGVAKVVFTYGDDVAEDNAAPFEYEMVFKSCGEQALTYQVYKTGSSAPNETKTINFKTVAGVENSNSYKTNYDDVTDVTTVYNLMSGSGVEKYISQDGKFVFKKTDTSNRMFSFKYADKNTGSLKIQYYEFDLTREGNATDGFSITLKSTWTGANNGSSDTLISDNQSISTFALGQTYKMGILLDFNANIATLTLDGNEFSKVPLTSFVSKNGADPILHFSVWNTYNTKLVFDNYKFIIYDAAPSQTFSSASIPGGDDNPVLLTLPQIKFSGNDFLAGQNLAETVTIEPEVSLTPSIEGNNFVVTFNQELTEGTTYTITVDGVLDSNLVAYNPYSLTFRTLNPGENPLPEVSLTAPLSGTRFYPGGTITLSAEASDSNGTINYVEFYVDDVLIEGSRVTTPVDGLYTYEWFIDGSINQAEPVEITAKACDNEQGISISESVQVVIREKILPEVTITSPEENEIYISNLAGVVREVRPTITFEAMDADGIIEVVTVYVDGESNGSPETIATSNSYTVAQPLEIGNHTIVVEVADDDGQTVTDSVTVVVEEMGKGLNMICDDFAEEDFVSQWGKSGDATVAYGTLAEFNDICGMIISGGTSGSENNVTRIIRDNLKGTFFALDMKVAFGDTETERKIMIGDKELIIFTDAGEIKCDSTLLGEYQSGEIYVVSGVVDAKNNKLYVLIDGEQMGVLPVAADEFTLYEAVKLTHKGTTGETALIYANVSYLDSNVVAPEISFLNGEKTKFSVDFEAGADKSTLKNNVKLVNVESGKTVILDYADGVFAVGEVLKYATEYKIVVLPDARDINGRGYSGIYEKSFITPEPLLVGVADIAVSTPSLSAGNFTATLTVDFNGAEESKTVYLVCAAYSGSKMQDYQIIPLTAPATAENIALALEDISSDATIEAFVVENMTSLNTVSDKIFVIK